ncbi:MAG TPA: carbohydrate ABC transporter permease [bacterium]|jgi:multiple sugar transport system permease protein|nr:carbohydrate ABC transporter permease [Dictyoglomota bacterium]HHV80957.1 carbohydrate ABC transporter permease [bacterium]HOP56395.1 carbohydrate ABC transporter permease [bacterium]HRR91793.1 carbohydrate ABC transporter permease [bacterium]
MKIGKTASTRINRLIVYIALILGSIIFILPFVWLVRSSFMELGQIFILPPEWIPKPFRWQNYPEALKAAPFFTYFLNTLKILIFNEAGVILTAITCAYSFSRLRWPGRDLVFAVLLTSMMLPYAVTLIPTFILWKILGGLNTFYPLTVPAWFGGGMFYVFLLRQFFFSIPYELDEAAYMDGANPLKVLWSIVVPLSKPAIITVAIFNFIGVWNDLLGPIIYLSDPDKYTLAIGLSVFRSMYTAQWHYLMAASVVVLLPVIIVFFIGQRYFIQGITLTGLKG